MSNVWAAIGTFLTNILILLTGGSIGTGNNAVEVSGIVPWITDNAVLAVFVLAIPVVSFSVGLLSRLVHKTFR